jgi:hypothetical protein
VVPRIRNAAIVLTIACGLLVSACGETDPETPMGCFVTAASFESSLRQAPEEVLLDGEVPISDCLPRNQKDSDLYEFGTVAVKVATKKSAQMSEPGPDGVKAAIDAGFLVGAMEKGAEDSEGIHATLVERVTRAASNGLEGASPTKKEHYEAGREAGRDIG